MDDDTQKAIHLSLQQTTADSTGTPNRGCVTTPRSDGCRTSTSTPSKLMDILSGEAKIAQPNDGAKMAQRSDPPATQCAVATTAPFQQRGSPKSTVAVSATVSALRMDIPTTISSHSANASYTIPKAVISIATPRKIRRPPPPLERTITTHYSISKKRRRDPSHAPPCAAVPKHKKTKKRKKRGRKRGRNSYRQFLADALRPKCTQAEKMKIHLKTIKKALGGGQIPKLERL